MKKATMIEAMNYIDDTLIQETMEAKSAKKRNYKWTVCAAAAVLIIIGSICTFLNWTGDTQPPIELKSPTTPTDVRNPTDSQMPTDTQLLTSLSYLTIDVNPSIRYTVQENTVIECTALNEEAKQLLSGIEMVGCTVEEAVKVTVEQMVAFEYLSTEAQSNAMILSTYGGEGAESLLETASTVVDTMLEEQDIKAQIYLQLMENIAPAEDLAEKFGVSVGKIEYILSLYAEGGPFYGAEITEWGIGERAKMPIDEIYVEPKYKAGDYDEYGELVKYPVASEDMHGYIPWEELSQEYKDELAQLYLPDDLAIMAEPPVWTTVPNVVGLYADEAKALMNSRKLAIRFAYEDNPEARANGYVDGQCFMQDISAGSRTRSGLGIFLWILTSENDKPSTAPTQAE